MGPSAALAILVLCSAVHILIAVGDFYYDIENGKLIVVSNTQKAGSVYFKVC